MASASVSDPGYMLLLPYTPREDSDQRDYDPWLREVDNPFFNSVEGVVHYTNWRIPAPTPAVPYTHFDFLRIAAPEDAEKVWADPDLAKFAANWTRTWGRYPDASEADLHMNYHVYLCERISGKRPTASRVAYQPCTQEPSPIDDNTEVWKVRDAVIGDARFSYLRVVPLGDDADLQAATSGLPSGWHGSVVGEIVATPD